MNNIEKNFMRKSQLRGYADGGRVALPASTALGTGMAAEAAKKLEGRQSQLDAAMEAAMGPAPAPAPAAPPPKPTLRRMSNGGEVEGRGGPTEDKVGPVMLSDGEFVLPADTVKHVGEENLESLIAATHKPTGKSSLRGMADGGLFKDDERLAANVDQLHAAVNAPISTGYMSDMVRGQSGAPMILRGLSSAAGLPTTAFDRPSPNVVGMLDKSTGTMSGAQSFGPELPVTKPPAPVPVPATATAPAPLPAAAPGANYQARRLSEMGISPAQQAQAPATPAGARTVFGGNGLRDGTTNNSPRMLSGDEAVNLGSYGGDANIFGTASRPGGRMDTFTGVGATSQPDTGRVTADPLANEIRGALRNLNSGGGGSRFDAPRSNADSINARFDKLSSDLEGRYGREGQGNLSKRQLELEQMRTAALDADQRNALGIRGQDVNADASAADRSSRERTAGLSALLDLERSRTASATALANAGGKSALDIAKAQEAAAKTAMGQQETGSGSLIEAANARYVDNPEEGQRFLSFIQSAPAELTGGLASLPAEDRARAFEDLFARYEQGKLINESQDSLTSLGGRTSAEYDPIAEQRPVQFFDDTYNRGLPVIDAVQSKLRGLFGGDDNVLVTDSGRALQASEVPEDNRYRRITRDQISDAPRRRSLRDQSR